MPDDNSKYEVLLDNSEVSEDESDGEVAGSTQDSQHHEEKFTHDKFCKLFGKIVKDFEEIFFSLYR